MVSAILLLVAARARPVVVQTTPKPTTPPAEERPLVAEKKWAVCVGAGAYTDLAPLKYAPSDARAFAAVLEKGYGFDPSTVGLIADGEAKTPTSATILGELKRLVSDRRLDRGDLFVFYFSGHGVGTTTGDYLMPEDVSEKDAETRAIPVKKLIGTFVDAGLKNVLIVADACRSGAKNPFGAELQELGRRSNIAVLLGCAPGQRSYEYPRLEKGVFTHFLVRAMADRSLAESGSGALWASAVAKQVATNVKEYTEADYGDEAQVPSVWSEASQDVLLAAFLPKLEPLPENAPTTGFDDILRSQAGKLNKEPYARYLSGMGRQLSQSGKNAEAIQAFKTLDGLGLATWRDLSSFAAVLKNAERENELGSLIARAAREPEPTDHSELVILQGQAAYVGVDRYRKALARITDAGTYGFQGATLLVTLERFRLRGDDARIAKELAPYVPLFAPDSMEGRYVAANVALGEGHDVEAIRLAEAATAMQGSDGIRGEMRQVRFRAAERLKDDARLDAIVREGEADSEDAYPWITTRLKRMQDRKDPGFLAAAKTFGAGTHSVKRLSEVILALGADAGVLRADAERLVAENPFSWQAPLNVWLATSAERGFIVVPAIPETGFKYAPDRADFIRFALNRWDDLLERARIEKRIDGNRAAGMRNQLVGWYARYWDDVQNSPVALFGMARMLMRSPQSVRGGFFAREFLWPIAQKQNYVRSELTASSLFLALNAADEPLAKEIFGAMEREEMLAPRSVIRYAMHQALANDAAEAERALALWPKLGRGEPDVGVRGYFAAIRALNAARGGDPTKAKAIIDETGTFDDVSGMMAYLALYEANGRKGLSAELAKNLYESNAEFSDLQVAATISAMRGYAGSKGEVAPSILRDLSLLLCDYPSHPWTREIGFNGMKGIANWTGRTWWKGTFSDGVDIEDCTVAIEVDAKGRALGAIDLPESKLRWSLKGGMDEFGDLSAIVTNEEGKEILFLGMKLPPTAILARPEATDGASVRVMLLGDPGHGAELLIEPVKAMTAAQMTAADAAVPKPAAKPPAKTGTKTPPPKKLPPKKPGVKPVERSIEKPAGKSV